jgi:hypothetical protein
LRFDGRAKKKGDSFEKMVCCGKSDHHHHYVPPESSDLVEWGRWVGARSGTLEFIVEAGGK